jgi:hypothetical protein
MPIPGDGKNLALRIHPADRVTKDGFVGIQHVSLYRYR